MQTLGDILNEALTAQGRGVKPQIEIVLHAPKGITNHRDGWGNNVTPSSGVIPNIKALRGAMAVPGETTSLGLTEAKAIIERIRDRGEVKLRLTAERYGFFMVNRHEQTNYNWQVKSSRFHYPEPVEDVFTI